MHLQLRLSAAAAHTHAHISTGAVQQYLERRRLHINSSESGSVTRVCMYSRDALLKQQE
jgi:hypothetical protein